MVDSVGILQVYFPVIVLLLALSSEVRVVSGQSCTQITTCVPGQRMVNCYNVTRDSNPGSSLQITSYVLENIPPNSVIYCLNDSVFFDTPGTVMYDASNGFTINDTINAVLLIQSPNREEDGEQITGRVTASDTSGQSEASLQVIIIDVNEFPPEFIAPDEFQHSLRFTEGERPTNSLVGRIQTSDDDSEDGESTVSFCIEGIGGDEFNVTRMTVGPVTFFNLLYTYDSPLDRERIAFYQLTIVAVDSISPVMTSNPSLQVNITIDDINDNAPQFMGDRMFYIPEGLEEGVFVGNVFANDADAGENATITYSIVSSTFDDREFTIDSTSGILRTSSFYKDLRFADNTRRLIVEVMAEDNGVVPLNNRSEFTVIVQRPVRFTNNTYTFELVENNNPLVTVGNVTASSPDLVSFYYHIEGPGNDKFTIDRDTGEITVRESLDRETSPMEMFTVAAVYSNHSDLSSTAIVQIIVIDVNDNPPRFSSSNYTFSVTVGQRVAGTVFANDSDSGVNSNITFSTPTTGTPLSVHNIGNNEAEIVIEEDETGQFGIAVVATDGGEKIASTSVEVRINPASSDESNITIIVIASAACSVVVVLVVLILIGGCLYYQRHRRKKSGHFAVHKESQPSNNSNGFTVSDDGPVHIRKRSILKVTTNNKFGSPGPETHTERVKFETRANMVMFELDQPTSKKEASVTTDTKLGSGDDSSICSGHGRHIDRDEGLILRKNPPVRTVLSSGMTDSDDETDLNIQLFQTNNNRSQLQPPTQLPIGVTNHAYSPPIHHYNKQQVPLSHGAQMLSSENLDRHNRAMAKHHRKMPSDQYSETSEGTGTYFTSDAEDGSAFGEPAVSWTNL